MMTTNEDINTQDTNNVATTYGGAPSERVATATDTPGNSHSEYTTSDGSTTDNASTKAQQSVPVRAQDASGDEIKNKEGQPTTPRVELSQEQQEAFNRVFFEKKQAEREAANLLSEAKALKAKLEAMESKTTTAKRKTLEDFDFDDQAYQDYLIDTKVEAKLSAQAERQKMDLAKSAQQAEVDKITQAFNAKSQEYAKANPSYVKALENSQYVQYSAALTEAVLEEGPMLDHHLLSNPALVDTINNMSPYNAAKKIAEIVGNLNTKSTVKPSNAPPPPPTVNSGGKVTIKVEDMSMKQYYEAELKRLQEKSKR